MTPAAQQLPTNTSPAAATPAPAPHPSVFRLPLGPKQRQRGRQGLRRPAAHVPRNRPTANLLIVLSKAHPRRRASSCSDAQFGHAALRCGAWAQHLHGPGCLPAHSSPSSTVGAAPAWSGVPTCALFSHKHRAPCCLLGPRHPPRLLRPLRLPPSSHPCRRLRSNLPIPNLRQAWHQCRPSSWLHSRLHLGQLAPKHDLLAFYTLQVSPPPAAHPPATSTGASSSSDGGGGSSNIGLIVGVVAGVLLAAGEDLHRLQISDCHGTALPAAQLRIPHLEASATKQQPAAGTARATKFVHDPVHVQPPQLPASSCGVAARLAGRCSQPTSWKPSKTSCSRRHPPAPRTADSACRPSPIPSCHLVALPALQALGQYLLLLLRCTAQPRRPSREQQAGHR